MTVRIATTGAAYSANKGAASMLQALFDELPDRWDDVEFTVLSTYPEADADALRRAGRADARAVSAAPVELLVWLLPLALVAAGLRIVRVPWRWVCRPPALRALCRADLVVDVSGISYSDARRLRFTVYGAVLNVVPMLLGVRQIKASQALGPFDHPVTQLLAKTLLPRLDAVVARGERSAANVAELGLEHLVVADDLAFLMRVDDRSRDRAHVLTSGMRDPIGFSPSAVVDGFCSERGIDHVGAMAAFIDALPEELGPVVVFPHSTSTSPLPRRLDDLPVCQAIVDRLDRPERCTLLDQDLLPVELRAVIERCSVVVTSRFHAMVSALAVGTPPLVVGWSHKYGEVLAEFDLSDSMIDYADLDGPELLSLFTTIASEHQERRRQILAALPDVVASSGRNIDEIDRVLTGVVGSTMSHVSEDLSGVIASSMCIGCGACEAADPSITVVLDPVTQTFQPDHPGGRAAAEVCPAVAVDFPRLHEQNFPGQTPGPFGVVAQIHLAQSTDMDRNRRSSSGGLIKELLLDLLADPEVDGIITLGHVDGLDFQPQLLTEAAEIDQLPGSIYHNLTQPQALRLLEENEGRFVLVSIPCHLEGIFTYIDVRAAHLRDRIHSTVGLLCGWQYSHHALRAICAFKGIDFEDIQDIAYRGGGPIGKLVIRTSETSHSIGRRVDFGYQVAFDRSFNTPRCHVCVNHGNFLADVVVGDAWLPSTVGTKTGVSLVVSRTEAMASRMEELARAERIRAVPVTEAEIEESQKHNVAFGDFAYAYADHLDAIGEHRPLMVGPNRPGARLAAPRTVARFHRERRRKERLQQKRRYRLLYVRKASLEAPRLATKYVRWFAVRVLRIKSLTGRRQEIPRDLLKGFR